MCGRSVSSDVVCATGRWVLMSYVAAKELIIVLFGAWSDLHALCFIEVSDATPQLILLDS